MSNFDFDLSLKLFQREVHDFSGQVQTFSGEVENDLRGDAQLPTPPLQIRSCLIPIWDNVYQCGANVLLFCFVFHSKQITLNETRDTLRETYKMVSDTLELLFSVPRPILYNENYVWNCLHGRMSAMDSWLFALLDVCNGQLWWMRYALPEKNIKQNFNVSRESPSFGYLEWLFHYWLFFDTYFEYGAFLNSSIHFFISLQIIELEESIVQLKEDLALEREEAIEEKERLQKAVVGLKMFYNFYSSLVLCRRLNTI